MKVIGMRVLDVMVGQKKATAIVMILLLATDNNRAIYNNRSKQKRLGTNSTRRKQNR